MMSAAKFILQSALCRTKHRFQLFFARNSSRQSEDLEAEWDRMYQQGVPRTKEEMDLMLSEKVDSPPDAKLLKVAIIGIPNSGKSTLINQLMGCRVCSVSSKMHTTRVNARAVLNRHSTQIVFLDTPGLITPDIVSRYDMKRSMLTDAEMSLQGADIMAVIQDLSNPTYYNELHQAVVRLLALYPHIPSILILNKIDVLKKKRRLLYATRLLTCGVVGGKKIEVKEKQFISTPTTMKEKLIAKALDHEKSKTLKRIDHGVIENTETQISSTICEEDVFNGKRVLTDMEVQKFIKKRKGWPKFQDVFMISALHGLGVNDLQNYLLSKARKAEWIFNSQVVTDQNPEEIALLTVREKFMDAYNHEIPYKLMFTIEHWELTDCELLNIIVRVKCKRKGLVSYILERKRYRVSEIAAEAEQTLRDIFRTEVRLLIHVVYDSSVNSKQFSKF